MYRKGQEGLRDIDRTLASLRDGGRQESRDGVMCGVARESAHHQSQSQQAERVRLQLSHRAVQGLRVSETARVMATSTSVGVDSEGGGEGGIPPWYEGHYTPAESSVNNKGTIHDVMATQGKQKSLTTEVEEDVEERVSQAVGTLYPLLLADVADYSVEREGAAVGNSSSVSNNNVMVVEWDEHGAPRRLRSTWIPNSPLPTVMRTTTAMGEVESGQGEGAEGSESHNSRHRTDPLVGTVERTKATLMESTPAPLEFNEACQQLYEYNLKHNPLKPIVLGAQGGLKENQGLHSRGYGTPGSGADITGSHDSSRSKKPQMYTEGIVIAKSSASSLAKKIRRAVARQDGTINHYDKKSPSEVSLERQHDVRKYSPTPICTTEEEVVVFTEVIMPVTAFFCSGCHACTPRDVSTGMPDKCPSCGEVFGEIPEVPPSAAAAATGGSVKKNGKKQTTSTSTATTTTTIATTTTNDASTSTVDANGDIAAVGTQAGATSKLLSLDATAHGLYFLHLWDQMTL